MSIVVAHDKRRREILEKALDVFIEDGFENVTIQKIAGRCGITRTTLYIYFKNKKEIFIFSIKQLMREAEDHIIRVRAGGDPSRQEQLIRVMTAILGHLEENQRLLSVVQNYLVYVSKSGHDPGYRVRRRTVRLRHILATMLIEGIRAGEFAPVNVREANEALYGLLEAAVFRLAVLRRPGVEELKKAAALIVRSLARTAPVLTVA